MKQIIITLFTITLCSCAGILSKKDVFIGDWVMSESSPNYSLEISKRIIIKITKDDIFYKIICIRDGEDWLLIPNEDEVQKKIRENMEKYQLSPDKRFLFNIMVATNIIMYNEDSKTITTTFGWFKKK